ncbi:hypothetical protein FRC00_007002 [Tulasnella sp. 408]|nr:hypothetical protein FRC00_007002 [Tulasnella sp. 408]
MNADTAQRAASIDAAIHIDPRRQVGQVDNRVFSSFIEHLGKCIYGGVLPYKDDGTELINESGFRRDVLDLVRNDMKLSVVRWPGGNFVSSYRWKDGIGPMELRPRRPELAWGSEESNQFGTDEFIRWSRDANVEPYICLNSPSDEWIESDHYAVGTGTLEDALDWVEYCNGTGNTYWANKRRENSGADAPYNVKYWGLGNEMYGPWTINNLTADEYTRKAQQWAHALKLVDPSITLISSGQNGYNLWDATLLQGLAKFVDLHSIHNFSGFGERDRSDGKDYERRVFGTEAAEKGIQITRSLIDLARIENGPEKTKAIKISFDEWGPWDETKGTPANGLEQHYDLTDCLAMASWFNVFIRNADIIAMANNAQLVNAIAPVRILTAPNQLLKQTTFYPYYLFSNHMRGAQDSPSFSLNVHVDSPSYAGETLPTWIGGLRDAHIQSPSCKWIDSSAVFIPSSECARIVVSVVNRHPTSGANVDIKFMGYTGDGMYKTYSIYHPSVDAANTFESPNVVTVSEAQDTWNTGDDKIRVVVKEHSFAMFVIPVKHI